MTRWIRYILLYACIGFVAVTSGCATQPHPDAANPPGFWLGLLHGFLIFFQLVGSIFSDHRIYAFPNSGGWYDFGYFLGASAFLGGGGRASRGEDGDG